MTERPDDRLTPQQIDRHQFRSVRSWRGEYGYDEQEVDGLLDSCAATIARLTRENEALRLQRGRRAPAASRPVLS